MPMPDPPAPSASDPASPNGLGLVYFPYLRGLAHELNNSLTGILGYAQLLALGASEPGPATEAREIETCSLRCRDLVALLGRCSRPEEGTLTYEPAALFEDLVTLLGPPLRRRSLRLEVRRSGGASLLHGHPWSLRAALLGLAGMALVEPVPEGGRLVLTLRGEGSHAEIDLGLPDREVAWVREQLDSGDSPDVRGGGNAGLARRALEGLGQKVTLEARADGPCVVVGLR